MILLKKIKKQNKIAISSLRLLDMNAAKTNEKKNPCMFSSAARSSFNDVYDSFVIEWP